MRKLMSWGKLRKHYLVSEQVLIFLFEAEESQRLDHFLVRQMPDYSRSFLQNLIKNRRVWIDGEIAGKSGLKLDAAHEIEVHIPPPKTSELIPENIPLKIIYEDKNVLLVDKPAGMVVHPSAGHNSGTLVHAVLGHDPNIEGVGGERRPGVVHRLDKDTSGLIILAKNDKAHQFLQNQFQDRSVDKYYLTLVEGEPPTPEGRVEAAIGRDPIHRQRMAVLPEGKGRSAVSIYKTLERFNGYTSLEVQILTGRTHQIRLHMAFLKCPVAGDLTYGSRKSNLPFTRQFLHAERLAIKLPGDKKQRSFQAPLPKDLTDILALIRN